ncbi:SurA N-terminal domain-containing protein [Tepidimonas taiwanensis]|uniref:Periplasmic chaperone PpiD n=1 Tax=Tepidimonas taiwanensis TaxID=307486 RepID=A0A554X0C6_9BURK|nr:SurA N-terminal domain-containing protein [Tepidimonas taiwanensis]TSE29273.1 Peptidyl-prolyl cis-trans isomerase D [Tepidimonas taiwanensis]UBQ06159.1 SurA N-terminal domain-containing protein [Tepidimonas taiwanensis]
MFDLFRNNMKVLMALLMLLIIPSFVFFGIEGYTRFREAAEPVARVGGERITRPEWDAAHRREVERLSALMPNIDRAVLESDESRRATLERLITERVLARAAADMRLVATDRRVADELLRDPTIASLRKPDGTLDVQRYQDLLRAQGLTAEQFEAGVRAELARRSVTQVVADSAFLPRASVELATRAFFEQREVAQAMFRPADHVARIQVSDADVRAYYDANREAFRTPEQAVIEYVVLDPQAVAARVTVSEQELREYYEKNVADVARNEQRRAAHILLQLDPNASAEEKARVRAEAEKLLAEVRAQPDRFAEVAKARSQDPGSAARGGDLDWFGRGAMVKAFEDAVFALKKGEISGVVETEFGLHIIRLLDVRQPEPEPFEKARGRLEEELRRQLAQRRFAEEAERFSNLVYEQPEGLAPVAQALGLTVRQATLERTGPVGAEADAVLREPAVLRAVFNEEALASKRNSAAIELGGSRLAAVRVLEHRRSEVQPFEAVAAQAKARLVQEKAREAALAAAREALERWRQQPPADSALRTPVVVSRQDARGLAPAVVRHALSTRLEGDAPAWTLVDLGAEGAAVLRVRRGPEREAPDAARQRNERRELARLWGEGEAKAYLTALRERYKVEVLVK